MTKNSKFTLVLCSFLLLFSCGLDVYYFIEPPFNSSSISNPADDVSQFFSFTTNGVNNRDPGIVGDMNYLGTQVYYKLYTNDSDLKSQRDSINSANIEYTENGIDKLLALGFQKLSCSSYSDPLIRKTPSPKNQNIKITFNNGYYSSEILVDDENLGIPLRYDNTPFSLENLSVQDLDVYDSNNDSEEDASFYILMYAVSVGTVNLSQRIYSSLCYLGFLQLQ